MIRTLLIFGAGLVAGAVGASYSLGYMKGREATAPRADEHAGEATPPTHKEIPMHGWVIIFM